MSAGAWFVASLVVLVVYLIANNPGGYRLPSWRRVEAEPADVNSADVEESE